MFQILFATICFLLWSGCVLEADEPLHVIPEPRKIKKQSGTFTIDQHTRIVHEPGAERVREAARYLANLLEGPLGTQPEILAKNAKQAGTGSIVLTRSGADDTLGEEGYTLNVQPEQIVIRAPRAAGIFYGLQTVRQLLPDAIERDVEQPGVDWAVPAVIVRDRPTFQWRGLMLDEARRFQGKAFVKRYLDQMALHKLNVFHWHLTDDQGWRIEIKQYPKLTSVGARRAETPLWHNRNKGDGVPYGPHYYTKEDIREIVAYARRRHITVVPEIDMPGHSQAAFAAYPWLDNTDHTLPVSTKWGIHNHIYNINERTFTFLENVLKEVFDLFPGPYIHLGGDEVRTKNWKNSKQARKRMKELGIESVDHIQDYFMNRMSRFVIEHGRRPVGWEEIYNTNSPNEVIPMDWHGSRKGLEAVKAGHEAVRANKSGYYFDYYQSKPTSRQPPAIGGYLPLRKTYEFRPVPPGLNEQESKRILGVQGQLWTEEIPFPRIVEYRTWPRGCALAEVGWTPEDRDWQEFQSRLRLHLQRLEVMGINFFPLNEKPVVPLDGQWKFHRGDNRAWKSTELDDSDWETVKLPASWESHSNYTKDDRYGWYRITVRIPEKLEGTSLVLSLGKIDDIDTTYVNGTKIGSTGSFPPDSQSAWDQPRNYDLPANLIRYGEENVIAVRVYDIGNDGGITKGPLGIRKSK